MSNAKILTFDIETSPAQAYVWGTFKQNVSNIQLIQPTRVLSFSGKWLGGKQFTFGEWDFGTRFDFVFKIWELLNEADVLVTYNGKTFDIPHLNREFIEQGMTPPAPAQHIDLYQTVRSKFRFQSGKLEWVVKVLELDRKMATGGFQLWIDVLAGDEKARRTMLRYNAKDVKITEQLYVELRPWLGPSASIALIEGKAHACPRCGSVHLQKRGVARTTISTFQRYQCTECGAWSRSGKTLTKTELR